MIEDVMFDVSEALRTPVLVATVLALAYAVIEMGALCAEVLRRRRRSRAELERAVADMRDGLGRGDRIGAGAAAQRVSWSRPMSRTLGAIIELIQQPNAEARIAKQLADFDYVCIRRLERTRILVRMGPALGLMGTLIPLSPALAGLAAGDVDTLTENLRVAFSVTVTGLLVGALAFAVSLVRDRLYGQDFSDAEYVAQSLLAEPPRPGAEAAQTGATQPSHGGQAAQPARAGHPVPGTQPTTPGDPGAGAARA